MHTSITKTPQMRAAGFLAMLPASLGLAALALCAPVSGCGGDNDPQRAPDILLVSLDTLRADRLSSYGNTRETSPILDRIARRGTRFAAAHAASSNTKPSHMSLFTGLDPRTHGVRPAVADDDPSMALSPDVATLPELLKEAGWTTASFSDRGGLPPKAGFDRGFDKLEAQWQELDGKVREVHEWLKTTERDKPLFLFFHTYEIHSPYLPPKGFHGRYTAPDYAGPFSERYRELAPLPFGVAFKRKAFFLKEWEGIQTEDVRYASDLYDEGVAYTDRQFGRLWKAWGETRDADNTILVVLSDHGEEFFEHEALGHKRSIYNELMHVPFIFYGPGIEPGVVQAPVSTTSLLPTLLDFLDLPPTPHGQAPSLLPLLRAPGVSPPSAPIYSQMINRPKEQFESVLDGNWRLIRTVTPKGEKLELFDHSTDPSEHVDLSLEEPELVARLSELLRRRREESESYRATLTPGNVESLSPEEISELEGLGYLGDD